MEESFNLPLVNFYQKEFTVTFNVELTTLLENLKKNRTLCHE